MSAVRSVDFEAPPHDPWSSRITVIDRTWFTKPPPRRQWLLRDRRTPQSDGVLPLGKVGQLVAEGGGGKTMALVQLAIAVATSTPWLGALEVASPGRALLVLGEEDHDEVHRRIYSAARAMNVRPPDDDLLVALPLAGVTSPMLERDERGNPCEAPFLHWLRARLVAPTPSPWRLIVVDPLSRFAGQEAEKDNAQATRYVEALESIATLTGATVLAAHHSNQTSRANGAKVTATSSRGVTALVDGVRWAATLGVEQLEGVESDARERLGELVTLAFVKSNYSKRGAPIVCRRDLANSGALVPIDDGDRALIDQARRAVDPVVKRREARDELARERADSVQETVLAVIRENPGITSRSIAIAVRQRLGSCTEQLVHGAVSNLCDQGRVFREGLRATGYRHTAAPDEVAHNPPSQEVLRASRSPL